MRENVERRFYAYDEATGIDGGPGGGARCRKLIALAVVFAFGLAAGGCSALVSLATALLLLLGFRGAAWRGSLCAGVGVGPHGLRVCYPLGFGRRYAWSELTDVVVEERGATLRSTRGDIEIRSNMQDWLHLVGRCQRALGRPVSRVLDDGAVVELAPETVAKWLGVDADGALVCTRSHRAEMIAVGVAALMFAVLARLLHMPWWAWPVLTGECAVLPYAFTWRLRRREAREVRATTTALDVRTASGWRRYPWGGLHRVVRHSAFWVVHTVDGDLCLPKELSHVQTLLGAIRNAIHARHRGYALPRMGEDVPDAALSRAVAGKVSVERGLSRADDDPAGGGKVR